MATAINGGFVLLHLSREEFDLKSLDEIRNLKNN